MSTLEKIEKSFGQSITAGVIAGAAMMMMEPNGTFVLFGREVNGSLGVGLTVAAASTITELLKDFVVDPKADPEKLDMSDLIKAGITGASVVALLQVANPEALSAAGFVYPFALGAGSEVAGNFLYESTIKQMLSKM